MARMATMASLLRTLFVLFCLQAIGAQGFSWGGARRGEKGIEASGDSFQVQQSRVHDDGPEPRLPNAFMIALNELRELESEPLCFRTAARLLINNCQVLDGQDDATILTNSDQIARDFVDSFAASLAICDLERGHFRIPPACSQFRESTLARLPPSSKPQLHVTTAQIDECLKGLAESDSAWNTWVTYKQKAMGFCEVARSDNQKDQTIKVHQKITQILDKFCTQVDKDIADYFESMTQLAQDIYESVGEIKPQVALLNVGIVEAKRNVDILNLILQRGTDSATYQEKLLEGVFAMIVRKAEEQMSEMDTSHQKALSMVIGRVAEEFGPIFTTLAAIEASALSFQVAAEHAEKGLEHINIQVDTISTKNEGVLRFYENIERFHEDIDQGFKARIQQVSELAGMINSTAQAAATLHNFAPHDWRSWLSLWSYVISPIAFNIGAAQRWLLPILSLLLSGTAIIIRWIVSTANRFRTRSREQITHLESNESTLILLRHSESSDVPLEKR